MLDNLLQYHQYPEPDGFVLAVAQKLARQHRMRRVILLLTGVTGVAFGLLGAYWLAEPLAPMVDQLLTASTAASSGLVVLLAAGALAWLLHDESGLLA
jgi:apolipoprotein N-acyltransferase